MLSSIMPRFKNKDVGEAMSDEQISGGTAQERNWESDCGPGSSGKLACAHCDIYYSWGNGQSWPREANLNILTD